MLDAKAQIGFDPMRASSDLPRAVVIVQKSHHPSWTTPDVKASCDSNPVHGNSPPR